MQPDSIVMSNPNQTLQVLNEAYSGAARGKGRQGRAGGIIRRQSRRMLRGRHKTLLRLRALACLPAWP